MSALREEIRAILREEIAAISGSGGSAEQVYISSTSDLERFVQDLLIRASDPDFTAAVRNGTHRFELAGNAAPSRPMPQVAQIVTGPAIPATSGIADLDKPLLTERDIHTLGPDVRRIRVRKNCRLTPLASDEARRMGIRIERCAK